MRTLITLIFWLLTPAALAQAGSQAADEVFDADGLRSLLAGQIVEFFDGSKSYYRRDGGYGYTYTDDGPMWSGTFETTDGGEVCVAFDNGSSRCDRIVRNGERLVLITGGGLRFPFRNLSVAAE